MDEINFEEQQIDANLLNKLYDQEKYERIANNRKKCLEISNKILDKFIVAKDFIGYLTTLKNLHKKKDQSGYVIYYMIQYSLNNFLCKINEDQVLRQKFIDCIKFMFENLKKNNDKNNDFDELKNKIYDNLHENNIEEVKELFNKNNFEPEDLNNEKKTLKKISLGEASELSNGDTSTKIEKLEISINKDYSSSTRNFNLISPNQKVVSNTDTFGINQDIKNDHMKYTIINKAKLPHLRIGVVITLSSLEIKRIFIDEMRNNKIIIKGDENSDIIQADKKEFNIFKSILDCFYVSRKTAMINSIQFSICYSENFHERIIDIKALNGKREVCEEMILSFIAVVAKKLVKVRKIKVEAVNIDKILRENREEEKRRISNIYGMATLLNYETLKDDDNSIVDFSNKEATNFYELYRILSQENYELGKSVKDFINNFREENSNIQESSKNLPKQMDLILKFIDSCVSAFFCYFNYGKSNTEKMLPYVRPAVENIIFKKLSDITYELYDCKFSAENQKFLDSQKNIKKYMKSDEVMEYLEINKKFRADQKGIPFKSTIDYINKIEFEHTPKDKFETLMRANLELRNEILDITRGKYELNSMDDELPLFIYIISQINLKNVLVELNFIENYLQYSPSLDKESKVLTNLRSSIFYISYEWKIEKAEKNDNINNTY